MMILLCIHQAKQHLTPACCCPTRRAVVRRGVPVADQDSLQQVRHLVLRPDVRHHLSKLLYAEEWAKSIEESHPVSEARAVTLAKHWEDVGKIKKVLHHVQNELLPMMQSRERYNEVMGNIHTAWF